MIVSNLCEFYIYIIEPLLLLELGLIGGSFLQHIPTTFHLKEVEYN